MAQKRIAVKQTGGFRVFYNTIGKPECDARDYSGQLPFEDFPNIHAAQATAKSSEAVLILNLQDPQDAWVPSHLH